MLADGSSMAVLGLLILMLEACKICLRSFDSVSTLSERSGVQGDVMKRNGDLARSNAVNDHIKRLLIPYRLKHFSTLFSIALQPPVLSHLLYRLL